MASKDKDPSADGGSSGKLNIFAVQFTADRSVYSPGDVITGEVIMELKDPTKIQEISVRVQGVGSVYWMGGCSIDCREILSIRTHNRGFESYMDQRVSVFGSESKDKETSSNAASELRGGVHAFAFEFTIPEKHLPFSYESRYGYVRYFITATIHKPWKYDHVTKRAFTVLGEPLDLNADPGAKTPIAIQKTRTPGILPNCLAGQVDFNISIPRTVYCCGESIDINAKIENQTQRRVDKTCAKLVQQTTYHATRGAKTISEAVQVIDGDGIEPGACLELTNARLNIPALPPTELRYCTVIDIQYELQLSAIYHHGPRSTSCVRIPLKLGNVPILGLESKSIDLSWTDEPSSISTKVKAPSYGTCVKGSRDIRDKSDTRFVMGHLSYTPTYIMHKNNRQLDPVSGNNETINNQTNSVV